MQEQTQKDAATDSDIVDKQSKAKLCNSTKAAFLEEIVHNDVYFFHFNRHEGQALHLKSSVVLSHRPVPFKF